MLKHATSRGANVESAVGLNRSLQHHDPRTELTYSEALHQCHAFPELR